MLIETDLLYAFMDTSSRHHEVSMKIFDRIKKHELEVQVLSLSLLELELLIRSGNLLVNNKKADDKESKGWFKKLCLSFEQHNISVKDITCADFIESARMRSKYGLSFFDSHFAAYARRKDMVILSTDKMYDSVKEIKKIDPYEI